jgi:heterodisulfide reductase subunit C
LIDEWSGGDQKPIKKNSMSNYYDTLMKDVRFVEGLNACMNCGVCTAICPAAAFYDYDPRKIVIAVQTKDDDEIEKLLKSETIWYCGECLSCKTRCPRGNTPAYIVMALRTLSQQLGFFTESEKGRQQFALKRTVGDNIFEYGYCVAAYAMKPELHPEQGPVWEYVIENARDVFERLGGKYDEYGGGPMRKIPKDVRDELIRIFEVSGGTELFDDIERHSKAKAKEMGLETGDKGIDNPYFMEVYTKDSGGHHC